MVNRYFLTFALLALTLVQPAFALTLLETSVDRNPAIEGEYLVLTIKADDDISNGRLDTSALLKDFIVGRTSVNRSTQIVNFDARKETRWQVLLAPKRTGQLIIPALTIDNVSSSPITLTVTAPGSQPAQMKNLFIRSSLSTEQAYVGQLVTYKVKLYLAVELQRGVLSAPNVEGAQLKQLGEDSDSSEIVDGRRYRVIERSYSIVADKPGTLHLSGATFSGDVLIEASRRGGMFSFNESRPMQAQAAPSEITILPIPSQYHGQWLVSDLVVLKEDWTDIDTIEVGTPITRNITLLASNTEQTSLPALTIGLPDGFKMYPEKPKRETFVRDKQVVSQLTQTAAIVPTQAGNYTLPEIRVPWFNYLTQSQEFATLPARTVNVIAASANPVALNPSATIVQPSAGFWPYLSALLALLWLLTLLLWAKARGKTVGKSISPTTSAPQRTTTGLNALRQACQTGHAGHIILALQQYFSLQQGMPMSLSDIAALSPALKYNIDNIQRHAYSPAAQPIDTAALLDAVKQVTTAMQTQPPSALSSLNPS